MKPVIALGILAALGFALYNESQKKKRPPVYYRKNLTGGYNAKTIPPFGIYILESQKENKALLEHELIHWKQYQEKGLFKFYFDYYNQYNSYGYDNMPMEIEARANEDDFCRTNYTHCVRNGLAKTIFEPNFRF
ncbi:hypothetical protein [Flavobacterium limnosediminis]|uniref:hypothetical protein n=1 Tax=Flavobacterium limnosediminis TaxID=1401027 RepID=UPI0004207B03|nr:hypothetical protein [Flavobacterium limnosediminis]